MKLPAFGTILAISAVVSVIDPALAFQSSHTAIHVGGGYKSSATLGAPLYAGPNVIVIGVAGLSMAVISMGGPIGEAGLINVTAQGPAMDAGMVMVTINARPIMVTAATASILTIFAEPIRSVSATAIPLRGRA